MRCFFAESPKPACKMLVKLTSIGGVDILPKTFKILSESTHWVKAQILVHFSKIIISLILMKF
jgi:hypothetical protein